MAFIFPHHKIKCMICKNARVKMNCDGICKNEFLLDTNIRCSYETKLRQILKKLSHISHRQKFFSWKFIPLKIPLFKGYNPWADTFFWHPLGDWKQCGFLVTSGCLLSRKVWWVVWIGSFLPKLRYFTDQNGRKGKWPHENEF